MRIDATSLISIKPEILELLKNLEAGDTLKGRVLEVLGSSIAIRTAGGQVFTAMLQEGASIPKGSFVELVVTSLGDGKIFAELKPEKKDTDIEAKVSQHLRQINLPVDEKNIEAAKLLIKYKLPLDKEAIVNITGLQKSIESLNQSNEGRVGLLLSGMDIKNTPVDVLNKIVLSWSPALVNPEAAEENKVQTGNTPEGKIEVEVSSQENEGPIISKVSSAPVKEGKKDESTVHVREPMDMIKAVNTGIITEGSKQKEPDIGWTVRPIVQESGESIEDNKGAELVKVLEKLGIETGNEVKRFAGQVAEALASIRNADMETLAYLVSKDMDATPRNLGMLIRNIENRDGISQFLDKLQQRIVVEDNPELKVIKEAIKRVFLEPGQVEHVEEVAEQLKDIVKLGERLERYLESSGNKDPEIRDALTNLKDNIDFIKSINEHNNFMQIPLIINGDTSTAKLYVFKEGKGSRTIDPENATILVALDLKSLGHIESMIGVKNKAVNVTFRVESKGIGNVIDKYSHLLKKSLGEKGYSLGPVRIISLEQPFSLLSLETLIGDGNLGKIHFDKRI